MAGVYFSHGILTGPSLNTIVVDADSPERMILAEKTGALAASCLMVWFRTTFKLLLFKLKIGVQTYYFVCTMNFALLKLR
ncbi:MAG: hypothetical protein P8I55_11405 [Crocinitomix sp.]|nr:hypothetical protein [Crocinitomix sp.]